MFFICHASFAPLGHEFFDAGGFGCGEIGVDGVTGDFLGFFLGLDSAERHLRGVEELCRALVVGWRRATCRGRRRR